MLIKKDKDINKLILNLSLINKPLKQFDSLVIQFLTELHTQIDMLSKKIHLEDLISFNFWLRPKNINSLK